MNNSSYSKMRAEQQRDFEKWTEGKMFFAFNDQQFEEGMKEIGLDPEKDLQKIIRVSGGGFLLKEHRDGLKQIFDDHSRQIDEAIKEDPDGLHFCREMFHYELANHEFDYTRDPEDALAELGYTLDRVMKTPKLRAGFLKACADLTGGTFTEADLEDIAQGEALADPEDIAPDPEQIRPGKYRLMFSGSLNNDIADSEATAKAVYNALRRFNAGDWGNLDPEDKEANNSDLRAREGHVLARYETPNGDIYIELIFAADPGEEDTAIVMYCGER